MDAVVFLADKVIGISTTAHLQCALQNPTWNAITLLRIKDVDLTQLQVPFTFPAAVVRVEIENANLSTQAQIVFPNSARLVTLKNCTLSQCPIFNEGLREIRLDRNNGITALSPLPASLEKLFCRNTGLTGLPQLPEGLVSLGVAHCQLQDAPGQPAIPNLPASLIYIDITNNQIHRLPNLPPNLRTAVLSRNQLQSIGTLPATLQRIYLDNNQLQRPPIIPPQVLIDIRIFENSPFVPPYNGIYANFNTAVDTARVARDTSLQQIRQQYQNGQITLAQYWPASDQVEEDYTMNIGQAEETFKREVRQAIGREQGRNVAATRVLRQQGIPGSTGAPGPLNLIGQFLTGQPGSLAQQQAAAQQQAQAGGRYTRRKGRKAKRSSTR